MSPRSDSWHCVNRTDAFVHVRLTGPVAARAYAFGNAARLGNLTMVVGDAAAARSVALLALLLQDVTPRLGYTYGGRQVDEVAANEVTVLASLHGAQPFCDFTLTPDAAAHDRCGEVAVTFGSVRFTIKDRTAAEATVKVLVLAYEDARHYYQGLTDFAEFKETRDHHRRMNKRRRATSV